MFKSTELTTHYKLIIIDDEPIILHRFATLFNWEDYGFQLCGTFSNSISALNYLYNNHIDLIVCDIKMPQKTGFDIAQYCYEACPNSWFIFVSAYQDFQYAQTAVKYNVIDYLTKPLDFQAFEDALHRAHKKLSAQITSTFAQSDNYSRQQLFSYLVWNNITNNELLQSSLQMSGLRTDILEDECALLTARFKSPTTQLNYQDKKIDSIYNDMLFFLPFSNQIVLVMIRYSSDVAEFLCMKKSTVTDFAEALNEYISSLSRNLSTLMHLDLEAISIQFFDSFEALCNSSLNKNSSENVHLSIVEKAKEYILDHYQEDISLQDIARYVSLSPVYFSAYFKKHTGENFSVYLKNVRLEKALDYLRNTDVPVESVCKLVGYDNLTYFYKLVKSHTNMTPNNYRKFWRKEKVQNGD